MNADKANLLSSKSKEPKSTDDILKYVKRHSKLGYNNCSVQFKNNPEKVSSHLRKLGFKIYIEEWNTKNFLLHIEW